MGDPRLDELRYELERAAPDVWPRVRRTLVARRLAAELLVALDRPPSPSSRLGWEQRLRVDESFSMKEVA